MQLMSADLAARAKTEAQPRDANEGNNRCQTKTQNSFERILQGTE
jgi:hypothetical protein